MGVDGLISVVAADDHPAMRGALARLVEEHAALDLVGLAPDGEQALELITRTAADVALLDLRMPRLDGLEVLASLQAGGSRTRVLFISGYEESAIVVKAVSQGAAGFLSKEAAEEEITAAIVAVAAGASVLSPSLQAGMVAHLRNAAPERSLLSSRERQLLELAADGVTTAEIAARLSLSPNTIKTYWARIYEKLNVRDRASAIATALRLGEL